MRSLLLFLCCFLFLAAAAYLGHRLWFGEKERVQLVETPANPTVTVATLKQEMARGEILTMRDFIWRDNVSVPAGSPILTKETFLKKDQHFFALSDAVGAGVPIQEKLVIWPTDPAYLTLTLKPEFRALAVSFNAGGALIDTVWPGSRIDVVHYLNSEGGAAQSVPSRAENIAENVRVLSNGSLLKTTNLPRPRDRKESVKTLILEVSLLQAEAIARALEHGRLIPALRSQFDEETAADDEGRQEKVVRKLFSVPISVRKKATDIGDHLLPEEERSVFIQRGREVIIATRKMSLFRKYFTVAGEGKNAHD